MRTFIAIDLPQNIKDEVLRIQNFLVENIDGFKWEKKEKFHITLKFLGEVSDFQYQGIVSILEKISATVFSFDLFLDRLNIFPNFRNPRVIVMSLKNEDDSVSKIINEIEKDISHIGITLDNKKFTPHITLGRSIINHHHYDLQTILENLKFEKQKAHCSEIVFYKSVLKPTGSQYIALKNFTLQKK